MLNIILKTFSTIFTSTYIHILLSAKPLQCEPVFGKDIKVAKETVRLGMSLTYKVIHSHFISNASHEYVKNVARELATFAI